MKLKFTWHHLHTKVDVLQNEQGTVPVHYTCSLLGGEGGREADKHTPYSGNVLRLEVKNLKRYVLLKKAEIHALSSKIFFAVFLKWSYSVVELLQKGLGCLGFKSSVRKGNWSLRPLEGNWIPHLRRGISSALWILSEYLPHPLSGAGLLRLLGSLYHSGSKD